MSLKTAILGGSFDPVHKGHLHLIKCFLELTDYQRLIIIPANMSNFKQDAATIASSSQRLTMLSLALEDLKDELEKENPNLLKDRELLLESMELEKGGVSYTVDTVKALKAKYNIHGKVGLVIGDDHLKRLGEWEGFNELKKLAVFLVFKRTGAQFPPPAGTECVFLDNQIFEGSSTEIRDGKRIRELLSPRVEAYVRENALYR